MRSNDKYNVYFSKNVHFAMTCGDRWNQTQKKKIFGLNLLALFYKLHLVVFPVLSNGLVYKNAEWLNYKFLYIRHLQ